METVDEKALDNFIQNFSNGNFYEAHNDLEAVWFTRRFEDNDEIKLIKGFINAAVSFELLKKGKDEQAKKVWQNYLKYIPLLDAIDSTNREKYIYISKIIDDLNARSYNTKLSH